VPTMATKPPSPGRLARCRNGPAASSWPSVPKVVRFRSICETRAAAGVPVTDVANGLDVPALDLGLPEQLGGTTSWAVFGSSPVIRPAHCCWQHHGAKRALAPARGTATAEDSLLALELNWFRRQ
jgi:hypothetical protein